MFCTIKLSKSDPTPLYIQLAHELSHLIRSGVLPSQTKLPTIRTLSQKLKINRDTVVSAYKHLENEGLIIAHIGSGTYVAPSLPTETSPKPASITCSALSFSKDSLSINDAFLLIQEILNQDGWASFSDPLYRERNVLKQSICTYLKSVGVSSSPASIRLIKNMKSFLLDLLKLANKSYVCVEHYHDLSLSTFIHSLGFKTYEIPLTSEGMDLNILEKYLKTGAISYIFCSPYIQNPTGISYTLENKQALLELCETYDAYIIEDCTLSDFAYTQKLFPLYEMDPFERVIYCYHFSKLFLPHLDYSFLCLPKFLTKKIPDTLECTLNERFLHEFLDSTLLPTLRSQLIESNYKKYQQLLKILSNHPQTFSFIPHTDGLFFWIKSLSYPLEEIVNMFMHHQLIVSPGDLFTLQKNSPYFRLSLSNLNRHEVDYLIDFISTFP